MTYSLFWLADALRRAGLTVVEHVGWQARGRGEFGPAEGVLCHHTAGPLEGDLPSLNTVLFGRSDLPGPLAQLMLARSCAWHVIAAGRCNHAGAGNWHGVTMGNSNLIGIEAENTGLPNDPWPAAMLESYARGVAALLLRMGKMTADMCAGHKEYALPAGRKSDPSFDMPAFRTMVNGFMVGAPLAHADPIPRPTIHYGDTGEAVRTAQAHLGVAVDGNFGRGTEAAVIAFQTRQGLTADGVIGPNTWAHLAP